MKLHAIHRFGPVAGIALAVAAADSVFGAPASIFAAEDSEDSREILDVLRSDANSTKIRALDDVLKLTPDEAEVFWPLYQEYDKELTALNGRRFTLLHEFFAQHSSGKLDEETAADLAEQWLPTIEERLGLWKKYNAEISQKVSPIRAVQFLQVEHQIALFIDLNIASEMPLLRSATAKVS